MSEHTHVRRAKPGDEKILAYIQTESWKDAFKGIIPDGILLSCTEVERAIEMYRKLLAENKGNGYILELNGPPIALRGGMLPEKRI